MLTHNYYRALAMASASYTNSGSITTYAVNTGLKVTDTAGDTKSLYTYRSNNDFMYLALGRAALLTSISGTNGFVLGNGTTPPTLEDYGLSGTVISTVSCLSYTYSFDSDDSGITAINRYIVENTGTEDIIVSEIAWFSFVYTESSSGSTVMIDRTLLDSPVTIAPGNTAQIEYKIRFPYNQA